MKEIFSFFLLLIFFAAIHDIVFNKGEHVDKLVSDAKEYFGEDSTTQYQFSPSDNYVENDDSVTTKKMGAHYHGKSTDSITKASFDVQVSQLNKGEAIEYTHDSIGYEGKVFSASYWFKKDLSHVEISILDKKTKSPKIVIGVERIGEPIKDYSKSNDDWREFYQTSNPNEILVFYFDGDSSLTGIELFQVDKVQSADQSSFQFGNKFLKFRTKIIRDYGIKW